MTIYVDSNRTGGTDAGTSWTNAYLTLQQGLDDANALTDNIFVHVGASSPHAETTAGTVTLTSSQADSPTAVIDVYGVDANNSDAPVSNPSNKTIEVTGSNNDLIISVNAAWHGIYFHVADSADDMTLSGNSIIRQFYDCRIYVGAASGRDLVAGNRQASVEFYNCIITVGDQVWNGGILYFKDCTLDIGTTKNFAFQSEARSVIAEGCDFSASTAGDEIVGLGVRIGEAEFNNCDMPTSWTGSAVAPADQSSIIKFNNCDDSNDYPRTEWYSKGGDCKTDTGVYITTSGWSDETANSTGTPLSHRMTPATAISFGCPLKSIPITAYIDATGSTTFTVELIDDFETTLQDDEVWLEISYHGTSGQVKHDVGTTRLILGDTPANLTAGVGTGSWTGEPASSRSVRLAVTATVNNIGIYEAVVRLGKYEANGADTNPGAALYVAPLLTIT